HRRIAQQGAPVEGQAQPGLRPPGDPLHERIGPDQQQGGGAQGDGGRVQGQQDSQADRAAGGDEPQGLLDADLARRDRTTGGAGDAGVDVAVDDVVPGAAGGAHQGGAQGETDEQPQVIEPRPRLAGGQGQGDALPSGQQQQPGPDRSVETAQLEPRLHRFGGVPVDPV